MAKVLFEITEEHLDTGLRGYPVGYCSTSSVDPQKGLFYSGKPVEDLAFKTPEEVIYLLYTGKEGTKEELDQFKKDLEKRAVLNPEVGSHIVKMPKQGHPMKLFTAAILIAAMYEATGNYKEDCLNLIAKIPKITAIVINHHAGWGKTPASNPKLGYMKNFTEMVNVPNANKKELGAAFELFNILHFDHGGGNLSTFVGKAIASGLEDMYGSIAGAMCALAGPRHGKANQDCLEFNQEVLKEVGEKATADQVEALIRKRLAENKLVFGFGHAVLRVQDPRATVLFAYSEKKYPDHPLVRIAKLIKEAGSKVLAENPKVADPHPNVDSISGTLLAAAGFNYPEYFTVLFGLSRVVGIAIQIVDDRESRGGKGTPIVRPKYIYKPRESK